MAPKGADEPLTQKDIQNMAYAMMCMGDQIPKIDNKRFASLAGYTEKSASVMWGKVRAKLQYMHENNITPSVSGATGSSTPKSVKATPVGKRRKEVEPGDDEDGEEQRTPSGRKSKKGKVKQEPDEDGSFGVDEFKIGDEGAMYGDDLDF